MDNQAYLDQISPKKQNFFKSKNDLLSSTPVKIIIGSVIATILIMFLSVFLNSGEGEKTKCYRLKLHTDNLSSAIDEFQPALKSSTLRGNSTSFRSILSNIAILNDAYLKEKYDFRNKDIPEKMSKVETAVYDELYNDLFYAKINSFLDRTYARKMSYECSLMIAYISEVLTKAKTSDFTEELERLIQSLEMLAETFDSFSETK